MERVDILYIKILYDRVIDFALNCGSMNCVVWIRTFNIVEQLFLSKNFIKSKEDAQLLLECFYLYNKILYQYIYTVREYII